MPIISKEAQAFLDALAAAPPEPPMALPDRRRKWAAEAAAAPLPRGADVQPHMIAGINGLRVTCGPVNGTFLFLHGGGYVNGAPVTHQKLAAYIARAAGVEVLLPDYRLAPENPFPAGLNDALAVWAALTKERDHKRLLIGGDSAGGGLSLALLLAARARGLPQPAGAVLLSPWTDILARGRSYDVNDAVDPMISRDILNEAGAQYRGAADPDDPLISPVLADLSGLAPMLVQVGDAEVMLDDSTHLAHRVRQAGGRVDCQVYPGLWHVWQHEAATLPEAKQAIQAIGEFCQTCLR